MGVLKARKIASFEVVHFNAKHPSKIRGRCYFADIWTQLVTLTSKPLLPPRLSRRQPASKFTKIPRDWIHKEMDIRILFYPHMLRFVDYFILIFAELERSTPYHPYTTLNKNLLLYCSAEPYQKNVGLIKMYDSRVVLCLVRRLSWYYKMDGQKHPNEIARTVGFWKWGAPLAIGSLEWWGQTQSKNISGEANNW